jgi:hypothetical protein
MSRLICKKVNKEYIINAINITAVTILSVVLNCACSRISFPVAILFDISMSDSLVMSDVSDCRLRTRIGDGWAFSDFSARTKVQ